MARARALGQARKLPAAVEGGNAQRAGDFVQMIPDRPVWRWGSGCRGGLSIVCKGGI